MRRLWIVLAVVFAATTLGAAGVQAATGSSKSKYGSKMSAKQKATAKVWAKSQAARSARGPAAKKSPSKYTRYAHGSKYRCYRASGAKRYVRRARPASAARGPVVNVPAPIVNVPAQAAPVVNVPQGPAPVVNVPPFPPAVGVTVDNCNIYIVQNDQLMVIDKNTYCLKQTVPLTASATTGTMGTTGTTGTMESTGGMTGAGPVLPAPEQPSTGTMTPSESYPSGTIPDSEAGTMTPSY